VSVRLAFVSASIAYRDVQGDVWVNAGIGRLIEAIQARAPGLTVALSHTDARQDQHDHVLRVPTGRIAFLPPMGGIAEGLLMGREVQAALARVERGADVSIVQLPFSAPLGLRGPSCPRLYHVVGHIVTAVDASTRYTGASRVAARTAARGIDRLQRRLIQAPTATCVTNGAELFAHYGGRGRPVVSSTLSLDEVGSVSRQRAPTAPFRILFVGFMRPEKGIDLLLDAFVALTKRDPSAELVVVGGVDAGMGVAALIRDRVAAVSAHARVIARGPIRFGPALFQEYADADVLVVPSRSEGTPRVLVEARAFGCPVIGTRVGGIPTSITDGVDGLLVPPEDVPALIDAIEKIRVGYELRQHLIRGGYQRARATTVEAQAAAIVDEALALAARCGGRPLEPVSAA
jgi:glycosyltransferase involved in cell wall biosynthesis